MFFGRVRRNHAVYAVAPNSQMIIANILTFGPIDLLLLVSFITWNDLSFLYCKEVTINSGGGYKNCGGVTKFYGQFRFSIISCTDFMEKLLRSFEM